MHTHRICLPPFFLQMLSLLFVAGIINATHAIRFFVNEKVLDPYSPLHWRTRNNNVGRSVIWCAHTHTHTHTSSTANELMCEVNVRSNVCFALIRSLCAFAYHRLIVCACVLSYDNGNISAILFTTIQYTISFSMQIQNV